MYIPYTKITTNSITMFQLWEGRRKQNYEQKLKGKELRKNTNGKLSKAAEKKLRGAINTLLYFARNKHVYDKATDKSYHFKLNFITLTLTEKQKHPDSYITNKVLGEFLRKWRKRNPELQYVWKAEKQDNGNIHYHLTTNVFIHHEILKKKWNEELKKHNYLNKTAGLEANSTDIKAVRKVANIAAYLCTYLSKKDIYKKPLKRWHKMYDMKIKTLQTTEFKLPKKYFSNIKEKVKCSLWGASKAILNFNYTQCIEGDDLQQELIKEVFSKYEGFRNEYVISYFLKPDVLKNLPLTSLKLKQLYNERLKEYNISNNLIYQVN